MVQPWPSAHAPCRAEDTIVRPYLFGIDRIVVPSQVTLVLELINSYCSTRCDRGFGSHSSLYNMDKSNSTIAIALACLLPAASACSFVAKTTGLGSGSKSTGQTAPRPSAHEPAPAINMVSTAPTSPSPVAADPTPTAPVAAPTIALKPDDGFTGPATSEVQRAVLLLHQGSV